MRLFGPFRLDVGEQRLWRGNEELKLRRKPESTRTHFEELAAGLPEPLRAGPYGRTAFAPCVVELYSRAGEPERALRELDEALEFVEVSDERAWSAELHRVRGELVASDARAAEREFLRAKEIAHEQGARSFELRALMSLVKLYRNGETRRSALRELGSAYEGFSEGFTTGDLVEAKQLLGAA